MKKAIVLCSGGLDSVVCAHHVKKNLKYTSITILFFNYGQRSLNEERKAAQICAKALGATFCEISLSLDYLNVPLTSKRKNVLTGKDLKDTKFEHNAWYVPGRNTLFLSYALSLSDSLGKCDIFVGFKCEGREPYPDTTPTYLASMNKLASTAFKNIKIYAPLIKKDKEDIIKIGIKLGVDIKKTMSCYKANSLHCGTCLACRLRKQGFYWANLRDPTSYAL